MKEQIKRPKREEFIIEYKNQPISPTMYVRTDWQQYSKALEAYIDHLTAEQCCEPAGDGFYLGTTCPKCNQPFRRITAEQGEKLTEDEISELAKIGSESIFVNVYDEPVISHGGIIKIINRYIKMNQPPELTVREVVDYIKQIGANNFTVWELHDWEFAISKNDSHRYIKSGETLDELTKIIRS